MSFKLTHLIAMAFAMLLVAMGTHQVDAQKLPFWCVCDNVDYTRTLCQPALARGNLMEALAAWINKNPTTALLTGARTQRDSQHKLHCWN
jgi:hypothetical protein